MNKNTEIIDRYLQGQMSAEEKKNFEEALSKDETLRTEVGRQKNILEGVKRSGLKSSITKSFKQARFKNKLGKWVLGFSIAVLASGVFLWAKKEWDQKSENNIRYELNENGEKKFAEADKRLKSQVFIIHPAKDTLIETAGGIVISIPANAFLNKYGETETNPVEIEIKEALNPYDIISSGLSTLSDGLLLETGGMFYLNARVNGENLSITHQKTIYANVPANKTEAMQVFDGKRMPDGSINWINPEPITKSLTTVDIRKLNFYPQAYLDSLKKWGYNSKNKQFTDSLYFSFGGFCDTLTESTYLDYPNPARPESKTDSTKTPLQLAASLTKKTDGKSLFRSNCAVCHTLNSTKLTGPGLGGIMNRVPGGSWLFNFIKNNNRVISSGDPYALKLVENNGGTDGMGEFDFLQDEEVNAIIAYISSGKSGFNKRLEDSKCPEISPSRIKAIWDTKFNNTLIATKEFEARLQLIFKTCNVNIFNLYLNNLDKNISDIDSVAAGMTDGQLKHQFWAYYLKHDGGVQIENEQIMELQNYVSRKKQLYDEAAQQAFQKFYEEEYKKDEIAATERNNHWNKEINRNAKLLEKEIELNLKEAYRQLGKPYNPVPPANNYYTVPVRDLGWKNVDRYVIESTVARNTLNYTDPETGKKVNISYNKVTLNIKDNAAYDKVMAYLLPKNLNSYQLMKVRQGKQEESLNSLITYSLVVLGFKGKGTYFYDKMDLKPEEFSIVLQPMDKSEITSILQKLSPASGKTDFLEEFRYQVFDQNESLRIKHRESMENLRSKIIRVIFPCYDVKQYK